MAGRIKTPLAFLARKIGNQRDDCRVLPNEVRTNPFAHAVNDSRTLVTQNQRIHTMTLDESTDVRTANGHSFYFYDYMPLLGCRLGDILIGDDPFVFQD